MIRAERIITGLIVFVVVAVFLLFVSTVLTLRGDVKRMRDQVRAIKKDVTTIVEDQVAAQEQEVEENRRIIRVIRRHNQRDHNKLKKESRFIVRFITRVLKERGIPVPDIDGGRGSPNQQ